MTDAPFDPAPESSSDPGDNTGCDPCDSASMGVNTDYDALFAASFERVLATGAYNPALIEDFYTHFIAASTFIAEKFARTNMATQRTMLHDSLLTLVDFYRTKVPTEQLRKLARVHSRRQHDIPPEFYRLWLDSLMRAMKQHDPGFNPDVELAWRVALAPGIAFMAFHYEETAIERH